MCDEASDPLEATLASVTTAGSSQRIVTATATIHAAAPELLGDRPPSRRSNRPRPEIRSQQRPAPMRTPATSTGVDRSSGSK